MKYHTDKKTREMGMTAHFNDAMEESHVHQLELWVLDGYILQAMYPCPYKSRAGPVIWNHTVAVLHI